jgi:hypothetical protein
VGNGKYKIQKSADMTDPIVCGTTTQKAVALLQQEKPAFHPAEISPDLPKAGDEVDYMNQYGEQRKFSVIEIGPKGLKLSCLPLAVKTNYSNSCAESGDSGRPVMSKNKFVAFVTSGLPSNRKNGGEGDIVFANTMSGQPEK